MIKTVVTLLRGSAAAAEEELADRHALAILDQQMRDVQAAADGARRALASALAEDRQEAQRAQSAAARIAGLEARARAALAAGRRDLAEEAAESIAELEAGQESSARSRALVADEVGRLRRAVSDTERRLADLHRGRGVARVAEAVRRSRRGRFAAADPRQATLPEAEATLARLRERQAREASAEAALDALEAGATLDERLAEAGFGPPDRPTAASVLARLTDSTPT